MNHKHKIQLAAIAALGLADVSGAWAQEALPSSRRVQASQSTYYNAEPEARQINRSILKSAQPESLPEAARQMPQPVPHVYWPGMNGGTNAPVNSQYTPPHPYFGSPYYTSCRHGNSFYGEPLGHAVNTCINLQVAAGQAAQMFLYQYDFGSADGNHASHLNLRGFQQLAKYGSWMMQTPMPLTIEAVPGDPALNEARRQFVHSELERISGTQIPLEQVVVGLPKMPMMEGVEASGIYENLLQESRVGGISPRDLGPSKRDGGTSNYSLGSQR